MGGLVGRFEQLSASPVRMLELSCPEMVGAINQQSRVCHVWCLVGMSELVLLTSWFYPCMRAQQLDFPNNRLIDQWLGFKYSLRGLVLTFFVCLGPGR